MDIGNALPRGSADFATASSRLRRFAGAVAGLDVLEMTDEQWNTGQKREIQYLVRLTR